MFWSIISMFLENQHDIVYDLVDAKKHCIFDEASFIWVIVKPLI